MPLEKSKKEIPKLAKINLPAQLEIFGGYDFFDLRQDSIVLVIEIEEKKIVALTEHGVQVFPKSYLELISDFEC